MLEKENKTDFSPGLKVPVMAVTLKLCAQSHHFKQDRGNNEVYLYFPNKHNALSCVIYTKFRPLRPKRYLSFSASVFNIFVSPPMEETEEIIYSLVMYGDREDGREER